MFSTKEPENDLDLQTLQFIKEENPWDRVKRLLVKNPLNHQAYPEADWISSIRYFSSTAAGILAFAVSAPGGRANYQSANIVTVYETQKEGLRKSWDAYMYGGGKRFLKWMIISHVAITVFANTAVALELYRLETDPFHYFAGGALVGGVSRCIMGPKALFAGSLIGGSVGILAGTGFIGIQYLTGSHIEQRYFNEVRERLAYLRHLEDIQNHYSKVVGTSHKDSKTANSSSSSQHKISEAVTKAGITATVSAKE